jgi:N-acetyl-anhydromuramyl-L-alanine amidase AmpD
MRRINLIVIHCSATKSTQNFPVTSLIACHAARFGFTGYHYYITRDGQLYQTRHENLPGAHARHYNRHSIGVCYEGGLDTNGHPANTRTPAQKAMLRHLLQSLKQNHPDAEILGHRDLPHVAKSCPCFDAKTEYSQLNGNQK